VLVGVPVVEGFVASRQFSVSDRAAKISLNNLVRHATRYEAIQAGKKPCHECNP